MSISEQQVQLFKKCSFLESNIIILSFVTLIGVVLIGVMLAIATDNAWFGIISFFGVPSFSLHILHNHIQKNLVHGVIGDEEYSLRFITSALNYLGHKTKELSYNRSLIVDYTSLVQMTYLINSRDIDEICVVASSKGLTHMAICDKYFGKGVITDAGLRLAKERNVEIFDRGDVYKTVYEKIMINRKLDKTVKTENQSHA